MKLAALVLTLALPALAGKKPAIVWQSGIVVDSQASPAAVLRNHPVVETISTVSGREFLYTISDPVDKDEVDVKGWLGAGSRNHWKDCRYIVGDKILYVQEGRTLHILDVDGKECKLDIIRQERVPQK